MVLLIKAQKTESYKKQSKGRFANVSPSRNRKKYGIANTCIRGPSCRNEKNESTRINEYSFAVRSRCVKFNQFLLLASPPRLHMLYV